MRSLEFAIVPHVGIGPLKLGASRDDARRAADAVGLGFEHHRNAVDFFCDSRIQTECDPSGNIWFIGVSFTKRVVFTYNGSNVFNLPAQALFLLIAGADGSGVHSYNHNSYCFPNQVVTLWDADPQYDCLGGETRPIWAQVGIGNVAYATAIKSIKGKV